MLAGWRRRTGNDDAAYGEARQASRARIPVTPPRAGMIVQSCPFHVPTNGQLSPGPAPRHDDASYDEHDDEEQGKQSYERHTFILSRRIDLTYEL